MINLNMKKMWIGGDQQKKTDIVLRKNSLGLDAEASKGDI